MAIARRIHCKTDALRRNQNIADRNSALARGFVKLKKIQKSEKNSEVGGWVMPKHGFFVCFLCVFFVSFS